MDTQQMKDRLIGEKATVEAELSTVGRRNPQTPGDWVATPGQQDSAATEPDEIADKIEDFEENTAIVRELEIRLGDIDTALLKIEAGTYGICEVSGEPIEEDRLEANPAARTCKAHMGN
jgi:RNA polymerase-binding transcription factor DksA